MVDLSLGTSVLENKLKIGLSGNLDYRDRDMETYYAFALGEYVPGDQVPDYTTGAFDDNFPIPEKSKERKGVNAFVDYSANKNVSFNFLEGYRIAMHRLYSMSEIQRFYQTDHPTQSMPILALKFMG